ncbi:MAG TPA: polymer-forming cytoskeletal protein, partial [Candidatus Polarisedimenticolaceae bacterium]|nr:polymer-forming cytoskeletal protein [Candidatus Polarisedimenticolaceae bacterium]
PPEPPTPEKPQIDDEDMEPPEPPHKEISLKGIHVRAGETHHGDISAIAPSGAIEGIQDGDVYMWSGPLRITGTVNGDVFFFGSELTVTGTIKQSLRAACGEVVIDGTVEGNVFAPAGSVVIGSKGHVKGNMTALSGQFVHSGIIDGTLKFSGGNVVLGGKVGEDAELEADTIAVDKGARVEGDISYSARNRMDDELKAIAGGDVAFEEKLDKRDRGPRGPGLKGTPSTILPSKGLVFLRVLFFSASFLFGCALLALFGVHEPKVVNAIRTDALRCAGVGFVSILVTIAVCLSVILIITIIFIPIYLLLYAVAWYLAKIPVALWLGRTIFEKFNKQTGPYLALLVGLVVLYPIFWIPYLGWVAWFAVHLLGLGAMITTYLAHREARKAAAAVPPAQTPIAS